ncbi:MAG TPA: 3-hydroxyacyl-CoA dehydrogenase NAD-binding domain-containing protein [Myxococcota bacterium]|nr:3-hydroxyacyl-CoA dehydrogenase NAD-binding domain-containing protein [Myxococcota bacterium]
MAIGTAALPLNPLLIEPSRPLPKRVAIVGAGTIGPDIGYYLKSAIPGLELVLVDINEQALQAAVGRYGKYAAKGVARRKMSPEQAEEVQQNITTTTDYADMAGCDWVIEAATEDLPLKRKIFSMIEAVVDQDCVITSNTSSLPASELFCELQHPGRTTVTHFFAPAWRNPAVEVIAWDKGDEEVVSWLRWLFATTGKVPLITDDALCFMLDRVFDNWCNEAVLCLDEGATTLEVDSVAHDYVHAGPFFVLNLARGNPIIWHTNTLQMQEGEHYRPASLFRSVDTWVTLKPGQRIEVSDETTSMVRTRILGSLFSQSYDILDRGIGSQADLELGCTLALGFKQGPLGLMARLGDEDVAAINAGFAEQRPGGPGPEKALAEYTEFSQHVLVDDLGDVKVLTMRRPQAMNALDDTVTNELLAAIKTHENDPAVKGFVIVGYGEKAFCAGADIGRFPKCLGDKELSVQYARDCSHLLRHLDGMDKPVVAALNGMALGGGLELALRCHGIVASKRAFLQFPEITLGIAPGIGGMVVPYRRWPQAASVFNEMLRTATRLKANNALELGILDGIADDYLGLVQLAAARVGELASDLPRIQEGPVELGELPAVEPMAGKQLLSVEVIGIIGRAISAAAAAPTLDEALELGYAAFGDSACTAAATEGVTCFLGRKRPDFSKTG